MPSTVQASRIFLPNRVSPSMKQTFRSPRFRFRFQPRRPELRQQPPLLRQQLQRQPPSPSAPRRGAHQSSPHPVPLPQRPHRFRRPHQHAVPVHVEPERGLRGAESRRYPTVTHCDPTETHNDP